MKKKIIIATILSVLAFTACTKESPAEPAPAQTSSQTGGNGGGEDTSSVSKQSLSPDEIYSLISGKYDVSGLYLGDDDWILNNYGLEADKLDGYVCAEGDELHADRIFIIKAKDASYVADVESKLNAVLSQLTSPEMLDYMPEQAAFMKAGRVVSRGNYVYLLISADADDMEAIIKSSISE